MISPIKSNDIVFIKHCTPQFDLHIKAVGIVQSDYPIGDGLGACLAVEWVWQGEKVPENVDEVLALCGEALYEEHNISVQREIINLLPENYRLQTPM
jgi:homoserine acetyltransferase